MNFNESLEYLYGLGNEVSTMKLGLENITKLLATLGNPQNNYLKVQVAGTNGKGSTCAFLDAICVSANIKTGLYTSPHLVSITERIKIGGAEISEKDFAKYATKVREISEQLVEVGELEFVPTFFEQVTAIALSVFAEAKIELAILETGLGGRFDATTAAKAEIVAITPIDYDHQEILGETLTEIAAEKAAIIREDTKVIVAPQNREAEKVILEKCREVGVTAILATTEIIVKKNELKKSEFLISADFKTANSSYQNVVSGLNGKHQLTNASLAISIAETLQNFNFKISNENITFGLKNARHKGRLEFCDGIWFDGAHNVAGAKALKEFLDEFIKQPITMIFGAMREKDLAEMAEILFPKAAKLILTEPKNPRSMKTEDLVKFVPTNFDEKNVFLAETVQAALKLAKEISAAENLICVTGSLYLVGEAQKLLNNKSGTKN
ncbi:MAG: bifunctional folylpolyglutamate synthase/dihydrofolate synthase [Pyrinomonadaceae bacterium]|nr:bifunctional folylpolyglutamate synthase/dihydrofolate synthase [Pyrinomonadaceae bacterium]